MPDPMAGPVLLLTPMVLATYGCNCEGGGVRVRGYAPLGKAWPSVVTNHFRGQAPANALELKAKLSGQPVEVPDSLLEEYPVLRKFARPHKHERQGRLF